MSRPPRSSSAATERVTIRLTDDELATLKRLAAVDEVDASTVIRRLIAGAGEAVRFVNARHTYDVFRRNSTIRNPPEWVYTLHHVPGRTEPLCVRRKVVRLDGTYLDVNFRGGFSVSFDEEEFRDHGFSVSGGWTLSDRFQWTQDEAGAWHAHGSVRYGLGPHVVAYPSVPTQEQRDDWRRRRTLAFRLLRATHLWTCWGGIVRQYPIRRVYPNGGESEHRGDIVVELDEETELYVNAFKLAFGLTDGAWGHGFGDAYVRVFVDPPTPAEAAQECQREREAAQERKRERAKQEERSRQREQQQQADEEQRRRVEEDLRKFFESIGLGGDHFSKMWPSKTDPSLVELGLTWPCTEVDVERAVRRMRAEVHPDRHGMSQESHDRFIRLDTVRNAAISFVRRNRSS